VVTTEAEASMEEMDHGRRWWLGCTQGGGMGMQAFWRWLKVEDGGVSTRMEVQAMRRVLQG